MEIIFSNNLLKVSEIVGSTSSSLLETSQWRPRAKRVRWGLALLFCATLCISLTACTESAGLGDTSSGWSPVAAIPIASDTGAKINEDGDIGPLDNSFSVTNVGKFEVGQVIQIGEERLQITATRGEDLEVARGVDGTRPQIHSGLASIYTIGQRFNVFSTTRQGEIQALQDDGFGEPLMRWSLPQERGHR